MKIHRWLASLGALAVVSTALVSGCSGSDNDDDVVKIGALLPLTGALSSYGETSKAALEDLAGSLENVELVIEDTKTDPAVALSLLEAMHEDGIGIVIGPYSSSEVGAVAKYANDNGVILISPLSTATTLALPGDNVFRFTPDDEAEGAAAAALAYADGVRTIVTVSRNDAGNLGLQSSFKTSFEKLGGRVVAGVTYPTTETDFKDEVIVIAETLVRERGSSPIGVYLTAFNEVTSLLGAASDAGSDALNGVGWYGSDSVALSKDLVQDPKAAAYAVGIGYPNPILGLRDADKAAWGPVNDRLATKLGRTPDAFALAAYDALNVAYSVMTNAGDKDVVGREAELVSITSSTTGLTGPLRLNEAGDRAIGIYDFWSVCKSGTSWTWVRTDTYDGAGKAASAQSC